MSEAVTLAGYLPPYLAQSKYFQAVFTADGTELDALNADVADLLNQCFVSTATWGLKYWEQFFGIPVDETKETAYRRSVILSRIRGAGTVTVKMIQNVAESYENGEVDVIEHAASNSFEVKFVGEIGTPPNLSDLQAAIEAIKPAHLGVTYTFTYNTYSVLKSFTYGHLAAYTNTQLRNSSIT